MSKGINSVHLLGNLGRDVETKFTPKGYAVATFTLAVNTRTKQGDEWKEAVEWVSCVAFGKTAEIAGEYLHKGSQAFIEGRLKTDSWDDKTTGEKKYRTQVVIDNLVLLGGKGDSAPREESADPF